MKAIFVTFLSICEICKENEFHQKREFKITCQSVAAID